MTNYEIYTFFLCLIVFILLTVLFVTMLAYIVRLLLRIIRNGLDDEKIRIEYAKEESKGSKIIDGIAKWFSIILSFVFILFSLSATAISCSTDYPVGDVPTLKVVSSASMSEKHKKNKYLFENDLNDQFQTFDIIFVYQLPKEEEIELYDIIIYEVEEGILLSHRVVKIEEPNENHPDCRWFTLQGDAVEVPDKAPVYYTQMRGIYTGQRIQYIGSFVLFLNSPAGWLCLFLILAYLIATPITERKIIKEKMKRLMANGVLSDDEIVRVCDETEAIQNPFASLSKDNKDKRSFKEKLFDSDPILKNRYCKIANCLYTIDKANGRDSHKFETFKSGSISIAKMSIRGKTLNVYLGLNPSDYVESKYIFTDESGKKTYINFPMRVRVTSDRKAKWVNELLIDLANKNNLKINDKPSRVITEEDLKPVDVIVPEEVITEQVINNGVSEFEFEKSNTNEEGSSNGYVITIGNNKNIRIRNFFVEYLNGTERRDLNLTLSFKEKDIDEDVLSSAINDMKPYKTSLKANGKTVYINSFIVDYLDNDIRSLDLEVEMNSNKKIKKIIDKPKQKTIKINGKYVTISKIRVEYINRKEK